MNTCRNTWRTDPHTQIHAFINNSAHHHIHRLKVKMWNQVQVRLMWKTDAQYHLWPSRPAGEPPSPPSYRITKQRLDISQWMCRSRVSPRAARRDALWRCCGQGFGHSLWSSTHWPVETMTQRYNNFHIWTLRPPEFIWVCDWLHTRVLFFFY